MVVCDGVDVVTEDAVEAGALELTAMLLTSGLFAVLLGGVVVDSASEDAPPHADSKTAERIKGRLTTTNFFICMYISKTPA